MERGNGRTGEDGDPCCMGSMSRPKGYNVLMRWLHKTVSSVQLGADSDHDF